MKDGKLERVRTIILLHVLLMFYSLCGICSKSAALQPFFSIKFCVFYGIMVIILAIYAIGWQQIIKHFDLSIAYANRAFAIFWSTLWAMLLFGEKITPANTLGIVVIFAGIMLVNSDAK